MSPCLYRKDKRSLDLPYYCSSEGTRGWGTGCSSSPTHRVALPFSVRPGLPRCALVAVTFTPRATAPLTAFAT